MSDRVAPRAGIFDFGGVMAISPESHRLRLAGMFGLPFDVVYPAIFGGAEGVEDEPWFDAEKGLLDIDDEFARRVAPRLERLGGRFDLVEFLRWIDGLFDAPEAATVRLVEDLRARGVPTVLLTNSVRRLRPVLERTVDFSRLFDAVVDSCEVGLRKPTAAIYHLAAERAGVPITDCLFLDDHPLNVRAAIAEGMRALHVTDVGASIAEARRLFDSG